VGTGCLENVHGGKFLEPVTGRYVFSASMTIMNEDFLPFREVENNPAAVRDCFGLPAFRHLVGWTLVHKRGRKFFDSVWHIGRMRSFNLCKEWFAVQYSDGLEEYTPSEIAGIYFGEPLSRAFHMAFNNALPIALNVFPVCIPDDLELEAHSLSHNAVSALFGGIAYSATAADQLYPVLACLVNLKSAIYRTVVSNPQFPLAGTQVLIPKTDRQAQQQPCAVYWNASKTVCLDSHHGLNAHCNVDRPDASVQVLDTKWVYDLKVCPQTRMSDRFKARIVANGQPQILGFDCHDVHAPLVPMCEMKMLLAITAAKDMELFYLDTTTAFISAQLKPDDLIYCNPPSDVDIGIGSDGSPRVWKLNAPLEGTRPAAMRWTLVLSRSFVQDQVADSSCECEYYAYSAGVKDMESVCLLIRDLCALGVDLPEIPTLFVDCEPAIAAANGASTRSRTKHIDFKVWLCRDYVGRKVVQLTYVPTAQQIEDFFTKQLGPGPYVVYRARCMNFLSTLIA
jgi:hypothetical protein